MKLATFVLLVGCCLLRHPICGQSAPLFRGAYSGGLGNAYSAIQDPWCVLGNIGAISHSQQPAIVTGTQLNNIDKALNQVAFVGVVPVGRIGTFGLGFHRIGDRLYNEQLLCVGFGNQFGNTSLGLRLNLVQYSAEGFGSRILPTLSMGGQTDIANNVRIGAFIHNINQPHITRERTERIPVTMVVGLRLHVGSAVWVMPEVEKDVRYDLQWKLGLEYKPFKSVSFRSGVNLNPGKIFIGFGIEKRRITFDYSLQHAMVLGTNHKISVGYSLKKL